MIASIDKYSVLAINVQLLNKCLYLFRKFLMAALNLAPTAARCKKTLQPLLCVRLCILNIAIMPPEPLLYIFII